MRKFKLLAVVCLALSLSAFSAQAQVGNLLKKAKEAAGSMKSETTQETTQPAPKEEAKEPAAPAPTATAIVYVSESTGSNRNDGMSKEKPFKDLQKAVDEAPDGAAIHIAQGNYQGRLNAGYISIKKYVSFIGGFNTDFTERDPIKYQTMIRPDAAASGTGANFGLFDIDARRNPKGHIIIDGLIFDKGEMNCYFLPNPDLPKSGTPEGVETGRLDPPGFGSSGAPKMDGKTSVSNQLMRGTVEGNLTIRNCMFLNGSHFAIQMSNDAGHFEIYNNIFLANRMAAVEIRCGTNKPNLSTVDFHHNTIMFVWRRDPAPGDKDMGYGFRYMSGVDAHVHHNIFGCIDFAGLDRTYIDSDKSKEALRKTSATNNRFFSNLEADLTLPSGGGKFLRVFARDFEDAEQLIEYEGNQEMNDAEIKQLVAAVDPAYLKGFLSMDGTASFDHNPNSAENQFRNALGMNMRGTSSYTVSMYMNRYSLEKAPKLFGALLTSTLKNQ